MDELRLSAKQVAELFEVLVVAPDLDKDDLARCQRYAEYFSKWMAKQMLKGEKNDQV